VINSSCRTNLEISAFSLGALIHKHLYTTPSKIGFWIDKSLELVYNELNFDLK